MTDAWAPGLDDDALRLVAPRVLAGLLRRGEDFDAAEDAIFVHDADGAQIVEFGRHDIVPGVAGDPSGYLVATKGEDNVAYIKWTVRAVFLPGKDGKPELNDNGFWEVVSGTGAFKGLKGAGTLHIKSANPTDRIFILDGQLAAAN